MTHYQVGGTLASNDSTYIKRQADKQLYQELQRGVYCYILSSRQMGKSSLLVKTMRHLESEKFGCVNIDISVMVSEKEEEFYGGIINELSHRLKLDIDLSDWWNDHSNIAVQTRLNTFINDILLPNLDQNIVVFIDEVDSLIPYDFKDRFFAFIRSCYNQRTSNEQFKRLTFCLFGVATPSELVSDNSITPFNIGQAIDLTGFSTQDNLNPLTLGLTEKAKNPNKVIQEILFWTGGQPFLTQKLCDIVQKQHEYIAEGKEKEFIKDLVNQSLITNGNAGNHQQHFKTIENRILKSKQLARLLAIYQQILENGQIAADDSSEQIELRLSGLVVKNLQQLTVYNPICQEVFDKNWLSKELEKICPYADTMAKWQASNRDQSWLLRGTALKDAWQWIQGKNLAGIDFEYLNISQQQEDKQRKKQQHF